MTKGAIIPLESYRLMEYSVPMPCYVCEQDNNFDAEFCRWCSAPMALAHQAESQKIAPRMIAVLGASGVGKTVYLGMLMDMLSRQTETLQLLARGAFSITLQQTTLSALSRCRFPGKTPNEPDRWNWVHCQVRRRRQRRPTDLIVPDMAGEAVAQEIEHPHTFKVVRSFMKKCTGAMILIDAARLRGGNRDQDFFTMKLISYLGELDDDPKHGWANKPVALVFTKVDQCEPCLDDPAAYAKSRATGLWQQCRERFGRHKFFAAAVSGASAFCYSPTEGRLHVPLRIEPHGVIEPFLWMLENLDGRKRNRKS